MTEQTKKKVLKIITLLALGLNIILIVSNIASIKRYDNLYKQYADQVIIHNDLLKTHTELTDAYWSLQQSIIKQ